MYQVLACGRVQGRVGLGFPVQQGPADEIIHCHIAAVHPFRGGGQASRIMMDIIQILRGYIPYYPLI